MSKIKISVLTVWLSINVTCILAQSRIDYFQQNVSYDIDAQINENYLSATANIAYTNNSPNKLDTIYFHLWMNALSHKNTPFSNQLLSANEKEFYFFRSDELGGYQNIAVTINENPIELKYQPNSTEIAFIVLPNSMGSASTIELKFKYKIKLPKLITRMGMNDELTQLIHWYPRLAVYDPDGWHTFHYLAWGEFYGEYSDFNVTLSHNDSCKVVAPFIHSYQKEKTEIKSKKVIDCPIIIYPYSNKVVSNTETNNAIKYESHYFKDSIIWKKAIPIAKEVINYYAKQIGPFPYKEIVIAQGPSNSTSAMEYPGLIIINDISTEKELEYYIAHELAHQYFYAALGFNERGEPFMDEGLATFFEDKYTTYKYNSHYYNEKAPSFLKIEKDPLMMMHVYRHQLCRHQNQSMAISVNKLTSINYGLNSYPRAAYLFQLMENYLGKEIFRQALTSYYLSRLNSHVNLIDFLSEMELMTHQSFEWVNYIIEQKKVNFTIKNTENQYTITADRESQWPVTLRLYLHDKTIDTTITLRGGICKFLPQTERIKNISIDPNFIYSETNRKDNNLKSNLKVSVIPFVGQDKINTTEIYIFPLIKYNTSDGILPSLAIYNSTFPSKKLKWLLNPSYSIINKELNGEAWIKYDYLINKTSKSYIQPSLGFKKYTFEKNKKFGYNLNYSKLGGRLSYITNNDPKVLSNINISYDYINEERAVFTSSEIYSFDNIRFSTIRFDYRLDINKSPTSTNFRSTISYLPEYQSGRDKGKFARLDLSLVKQFYYQKTKSFGLRLWTGYFLMNNKRASLTYNNQLVRGSTSLIYQEANDYAYDGYYIDRNNGTFNQSVSSLGGGFKTVFNNRNLGQSNDLAFAINLKCDLPIKTSKYLPLTAYFDFGGYSTPSGPKTNIDYLFSGGLSLTYFKGALQIHIPIINSEEINRIYVEEGGFIQRVSFSIDLAKVNPWTKLDHLEFHY